MAETYRPHPKQQAAHLAFLTGGYKRGVLLMGRQCLAPDTLVLTNKGHVRIDSLVEGDLVSSYSNEKGQQHKPVVSVAHYGDDVEPKAMMTYYFYDQKITSTYDHPFWYNGRFAPIYQLAWRTMEAPQREKLELLCQQYGQILDYDGIWWPDEAPNLPTSKDLVSHIEVSGCAPTVSIEVEDNHNYYITPENILVSNSGKTYFATNHAWLSAVIEQGRYFIVFKTYKQAHEVVWRQYVPLIPKELIYKKNEQDLLIELNYVDGPITLPDGTTIEVEHDQNKPRSTIQLLGSDQSDSHRGFKANGIIFDEYADQDPNNWDSVYKHFFTTTDGWAIFMGTPRGFNHFYDQIQYAKEDERWFYQEATWRDSPYVKREFIEEEKAEATKKGTLSTFMQEVELEFRSVQGAVYPSFDRKVHVKKPHEIPEDDLTFYGAIDFGWHTTAFLLWGVDKEQTWYLVDEVYGREETLDQIIPRIRDKVGDKRMVLVVGDSANRDAIEVMGRNFPMVGVNKANDTHGYQLGISLITEKMKPRIQLVGPPKPSIYYSSVCKNFIFEKESYRFPEDKPERNASDVPIKENDHGPDAERYLFLQLKHGLQKEGKFPKSSVVEKLNEYGL